MAVDCFDRGGVFYVSHILYSKCHTNSETFLKKWNCTKWGGRNCAIPREFYL
jgi:hypothetical protein